MNEFRRSQNSQLGMLPSDQRLTSYDLARRKINHRLVIRNKLLISDGATQIGFQSQPLDRLGVHFSGVEFVATAALSFCPVQCRSRILHDGRKLRTVSRKDSYSDAGVYIEFLCAQHNRGFQRGENLVSQLGEILGPFNVVHQEGELIPAQASNRVAGPDPVTQTNGYFLQQEISGLVAERVVDFFESIERDQQ